MALVPPLSYSLESFSQNLIFIIRICFTRFTKALSLNCGIVQCLAEYSKFSFFGWD